MCNQLAGNLRTLTCGNIVEFAKHYARLLSSAGAATGATTAICVRFSCDAYRGAIIIGAGASCRIRKNLTGYSKEDDYCKD